MRRLGPDENQGCTAVPCGQSHFERAGRSNGTLTFLVGSLIWSAMVSRLTSMRNWLAAVLLEIKLILSVIRP
jgi:hypothetical protein